MAFTLRGALLKASAVLVTTGLAAACSAEKPGDPLMGDDRAFGHVHGLGTNPADGTLYAATHSGVFSVGNDGVVKRIADRWQDTMGFTVAGPDHFLASGHPDLREDLPVHLGLIESTDAAQTWHALSLQGIADFHALETSGDRIYGYESTSGRLLMSVGGRSWRALATAEVVDLAADPDIPTRLLATTPAGAVLEYRSNHPAVRELGGSPPRVVFLDWPRADLLVGAGGDGWIYVSRDQGDTWKGAGRPPGKPEALDVTPGQWHVATSHGIYRSTDDGRRWSLLAETHN